MNSWICPYCGAENYSDTDASIVCPHCRGCGHEYTTAERLERQKKIELSELCGTLADLKSGLANLLDMRNSQKNELDEIDRKIYCIQQDAKTITDEIQKWKSLKIYLDAPDLYERAQRAKKDPCQGRLV